KTLGPRAERFLRACANGAFAFSKEIDVNAVSGSRAVASDRKLTAVRQLRTACNFGLEQLELRRMLAAVVTDRADYHYGDTAQIRFPDSISAPVTIATVGDTTAGTSLQSPNVSQAVPIGNTIIVTVAMDPNSGAVTVTDTKGNIYTKDADVTNGSGTSGVRTLVFSAPVTTALTTSDKVTVNFATSTTAKAFSVHS